MSTTLAQAHANMAKADAPAQRMVIVLTQKRIVRQGGYEYHIPPGSVIGTKHLPVKHTFNPGKDAKLVADPGNEHKPGDVLAA